MKPLVKFCLGVACLSLFSVPARALEVTLLGDRVTIRAHGDKLSAVLQGFTRYGVKIKFDPAIEGIVTGDMVNVKLDDALHNLLAGNGFVISWRTLAGPAGDYRVLSEVLAFRNGYRHSAQAIVRPDEGRFDIEKGPNGMIWVREEILLGLRPGTTRAELDNLLAAVNGVVVDSSPLVGIYRIKLPPGASVLQAVQALKNHPKVAGVEPNYAWKTETPASANAGSTSPDFKSPKVTEGAVRVAVLDTGLLPDVDFGGLVVGSLDASDPGAALSDLSGHGSQMAMIVSGAVTPTGQPALASGAPMLAVKSFDSAGYTSNFTLMEAVDFSAANDARILSLSWGTNQESEFMASTIAQAQEKGMLVLAAVGNEPTGQPFYPAAYPGVIGVGALNADGTVWEKSNTGDFVDLTAPGVANFPVGHDGPPGTYAGTSIATPWVAQALSEYFAAHPQATNDQAVNALYQSLNDAGAAGPDPLYGRGAFDAAARSTLLKR